MLVLSQIWTMLHRNLILEKLVIKLNGKPQRKCKKAPCQGSPRSVSAPFIIRNSLLRSLLNLLKKYFQSNLTAVCEIVIVSSLRKILNPDSNIINNSMLSLL